MVGEFRQKYYAGVRTGSIRRAVFLSANPMAYGSIGWGKAMSEESFDTLRNLLSSAGPAQALDVLIEQYRKAKQYPDWFEARMMRSRLALGLPLIQAPATSEIPAEARAAYEQDMVEAARETGDL